MAEKPTYAFVGSRTGAFCESPLHQRLSSGVGITEYVTLKRSIQAVQSKWGFVFPVDIGPNADYTPFADDDERVDWIMSVIELNLPSVLAPVTHAVSEYESAWWGGGLEGYSVGRDDWAYASARITIVSTPDPGDSVGTYQTVTEYSIRAKSGYFYEPTPAISGTGPHCNVFAVGWSVDSRTITYSESSITAYKKWTDGANTCEITVEYYDPISNDDCIGWVQDLWAGKTKTLDDVADTEVWGIYYWGTSDTLTESSSAPFGSFSQSFDPEATPLIYGGGENHGTTEWSGFWTYFHPVCAMRDAEFAVKGQHADYTQINQFDGTLIDQLSEKLPYFPNEVRFRYLANPVHWDDDQLTQKRPDSLTWYTTPTPDFPAPD